MALTENQLNNRVTLLIQTTSRQNAKVLIESVYHSADDFKLLNVEPFEYLLHGLHGYCHGASVVGDRRLAVLEDPEIKSLTHLKIDDGLGIIPEDESLHNLQTGYHRNHDYPFLCATLSHAP